MSPISGSCAGSLISKSEAAVLRKARSQGWTLADIWELEFQDGFHCSLGFHCLHQQLCCAPALLLESGIVVLAGQRCPHDRSPLRTLDARSP